MNAISRIVIYGGLGIVIYMYLNLAGAPLPLPQWFEDFTKQQVDKKMKKDPLYKLGNYTIKIRNEKDSLQHLVDSSQNTLKKPKP